MADRRMPSSPLMSETSAPTWKKVVAAVLDFFTVFIVGGMVIAQITGDTTEGGFELNGAPALFLFGLIAVYFVVLRRNGGTLWQRIFKIA